LCLLSRPCDVRGASYQKESGINSNEIDDPWGQADCLQGLADCDLARNDDERAHDRYDRAFELYKSVGGDMLGQGNCRKAQGDIALKRGCWEKAEWYYKRANIYHEPLHNVVCLANLEKGFGDIARGKQQYIDAITHYCRALGFYGKAHNVSGEAYCMKSLADTHLAALEYPEAKRVYERARRLFNQLDTPVGQIQSAACLKGLGDVADGQEDYSQAQKRYLQALPHFQEHNDAVGEAYCLRALGEVELRLAVPARQGAVERFTLAAQLFQQSHKRNSAAACLLRAGQVAKAMEDTVKATCYLQKALQIFDALGDQKRMQETQQLLDDIEAARRD
jgi:tetratricopeptide (TPR) repeat protein